jgi:hypothetical protein
MSPKGSRRIHQYPWEFETTWELSCSTGSVMVNYLPGVRSLFATYLLPSEQWANWRFERKEVPVRKATAAKGSEAVSLETKQKSWAPANSTDPLRKQRRSHPVKISTRVAPTWNPSNEYDPAALIGSSRMAGVYTFPRPRGCVYTEGRADSCAEIHVRRAAAPPKTFSLRVVPLSAQLCHGSSKVTAALKI